MNTCSNELINTRFDECGCGTECHPVTSVQFVPLETSFIRGLEEPRLQHLLPMKQVVYVRRS